MSNTISRLKFQKMRIESKRIAKGLDKQKKHVDVNFWN